MKSLEQAIIKRDIRAFIAVEWRETLNFWEGSDKAYPLADRMIQTYIGMHLMFNVDHLWPYFRPLLDTSNISERLTPTKLNPNCME